MGRSVPEIKKEERERGRKEGILHFLGEESNFVLFLSLSLSLSAPSLLSRRPPPKRRRKERRGEKVFDMNDSYGNFGKGAGGRAEVGDREKRGERAKESGDDKYFFPLLREEKEEEENP